MGHHRVEMWATSLLNHVYPYAAMVSASATHCRLALYSAMIRRVPHPSPSVEGAYEGFVHLHGRVKAKSFAFSRRPLRLNLDDSFLSG